jgi:hypothetical protein
MDIARDVETVSLGDDQVQVVTEREALSLSGVGEGLVVRAGDANRDCGAVALGLLTRLTTHVNDSRLCFASWSGVSYFSLAEARARLIEFETVTQALWSYCNHIREQVANGHDPDPPPDYSHRWLRSMRARLVGSRPRESAQEARMRAAILKTSELTQNLDHTLDILTERRYGTHHD